MKTLFRFSILLAIVTIALTNCSKDNSTEGSGKLSPPSWIQGTWSILEGSDYLNFQFTSNDILMNGISFKQIYNVSGQGYKATIKETKKTGTLYEVTITATVAGIESAEGFYSFKAGDGTYIEVGTSEVGVSVDDYTMFYKK